MMREQDYGQETARRLLVAFVLGGSVFTSATQAQADSFLDDLFGTRKQQEVVVETVASAEPNLREIAKKRRVSSPKYYTYKPDRLVSTSFAALAKQKDVKPSQQQETVGDANAAPQSEPVVVEQTDFQKKSKALKGLKLKVLPEVGKALLEYYAENPNFLWIESDRVSLRAGVIRLALSNADEYGLDPMDYLVQMPGIAGLEGEELDVALADFEMRMSAAVLTYILDAERGRVNPNRLSGYHDLPRHKPDLVAALADLSRAWKPDETLVSHHPSGAHFKAMKEKLAALRAADKNEDRIEIALDTFLKAGRSSPEMKNIVAAIRKTGSEELLQEHAETLSAYSGDDKYTPELVALVKGFQKEKKLAADGIIGKKTIEKMVGVSNADKIVKLELAMERSRWLPEQLGQRNVFINQPAFMATYTEEGKEALSMRVVVGKRSNQTSFFYDTIEVVEYNPYWGVPYSIIVNEMLPKLAKNPSYLDQAGYEVSTASGRRISSASVDWVGVAHRKVGVNVRQKPGNRNALGELKILFPNKHHIYMHDTPSKRFFKKDERAYSHGCVRLQDPRAMAAAVLGKSKDYVSSRIGKGRNEQERVPGDIPVYVAYFTAWPKQDGSMGYYLDVYNRDRQLLKAMAATSKARH